MPALDHKLIDRIYGVLRNHPNGVTAKVVANLLDRPIPHITSRLSRLALYGALDRVPVPIVPHRGAGGTQYRYQIKRRHEAP